MVMYHGSPELFDRFDLSRAGDGTGIKFGFGVYLTEPERSAVHYSNPRALKGVKAPAHYLYTVEIPDLTAENHLMSNPPPNAAIVTKVESALGVKAPAKVLAHGKLFRKWIGMTRTGSKSNGLEEEKSAAEFLNGLGVLFRAGRPVQCLADGAEQAGRREERRRLLREERQDPQGRED